jgi:hypothetical protein
MKVARLSLIRREESVKLSNFTDVCSEIVRKIERMPGYISLEFITSVIKLRYRDTDSQ